MEIRYNLTVNIKQPVINSVYSIKKMIWVDVLQLELVSVDVSVQKDENQTPAPTQTDRHKQMFGLRVVQRLTSLPLLSAGALPALTVLFASPVCVRSLWLTAPLAGGVWSPRGAGKEEAWAPRCPASQRRVSPPPGTLLRRPRQETPETVH